MIKKVEFLNRKSFNNYTSNNEVFKSKNLIFGYNGRGKSSLALGIVDQIKQNYEVNAYRFLNRSYLEENIMLEGNTSIKGVRAIFDKTNVDIVKKVRQLEEDIEDTSVIQEAIIDIENKIKAKIDKIHKSKKGNLQISRKSSAFSIKKILDLYEQDLNEAFKVEKNIERIKYYNGTDNTFEKELEKLHNLEIPEISLNFPSKDELEYLQKIFDKNYDHIDIPANKILEWIDEGIRIHNQEDNCLFCGNPYSLEEVKYKLEIFKKNEINNDIEFLKDINGRINEIIENSKKLFYKKHEYEILDKEEIITSLNFEQITKQSKNISILLDDISENISNDLESVAQFIKEIIEIKDELKNTKLNILTDLSDKNSKFNKLVKGSIAYNILYDDQITDYKSDLKEKKKSLLILEKKNKEIKEEIDNINKKASGFEDFKIYLNEVLEALELQFELISNGDKQGTYYLQHKGEGIDLNISDVSEGEKNLFSLLYFYHELYRDKEQNSLKDEIKFIILDDPISSLDYSNRFYVLEILQSILKESDIQVFILTHSWDDFCDLAHGKKDETKYSFIEVFKDYQDGYNSKLKKIETIDSPYRVLFKEIYKIYDNGREASSHCDIYHSVNSMRRVFEEFLRFKSSKNLLPQLNNTNKIKEIYKQATLQDMSKGKSRKLKQFLTIINVLSHRIYKSEEIFENAKFMMNIIKDMDVAHYNAMKE